MEGSVKSLIEAENEAKKILERAKKSEEDMVDRGIQQAKDTIKIREDELNEEYRLEQEKVSPTPTDTCVSAESERVRGTERNGRRDGEGHSTHEFPVRAEQATSKRHADGAGDCDLTRGTSGRQGQV